jgi:hypothetical protein
MKILFNIQYLLNPISKHYETNLVDSYLMRALPTTVPRAWHEMWWLGSVVAGEILADKQTTFLHK